MLASLPNPSGLSSTAEYPRPHRHRTRQDHTDTPTTTPIGQLFHLSFRRPGTGIRRRRGSSGSLRAPSCRVRARSDQWGFERRFVTTALKVCWTTWRDVGFDATSMASSAGLKEEPLPRLSADRDRSHGRGMPLVGVTQRLPHASDPVRMPRLAIHGGGPSLSCSLDGCQQFPPSRICSRNPPDWAVPGVEIAPESHRGMASRGASGNCWTGVI